MVKSSKGFFIVIDSSGCFFTGAEFGGLTGLIEGFACNYCFKRFSIKLSAVFFDSGTVILVLLVVKVEFTPNLSKS